MTVLDTIILAAGAVSFSTAINLAGERFAHLRSTDGASGGRALPLDPGHGHPRVETWGARDLLLDRFSDEGNDPDDEVEW